MLRSRLSFNLGAEARRVKCIDTRKDGAARWVAAHGWAEQRRNWTAWKRLEGNQRSWVAGIHPTSPAAAARYYPAHDVMMTLQWRQLWPT